MKKLHVTHFVSRPRDMATTYRFPYKHSWTLKMSSHHFMWIPCDRIRSVFSKYTWKKDRQADNLKTYCAIYKPFYSCRQLPISSGHEDSATPCSLLKGYKKLSASIEKWPIGAGRYSHRRVTKYRISRKGLRCWRLNRRNPKQSFRLLRWPARVRHLFLSTSESVFPAREHPFFLYNGENTVTQIRENLVQPKLQQTVQSRGA